MKADTQHSERSAQRTDIGNLAVKVSRETFKMKISLNKGVTR